MLDRDLALYVQRRTAKLDWTAKGLAEARFWITLNESRSRELEGRIDDAIEAASRAEALAPSSSPALALEALCRRACVHAHEGERYALRDLARRISAAFTALGHKSLVGDERTVALAVAEVLAISGDGVNAHRTLCTYRANNQLSPMLSMAMDPRRKAYEQLVEAQIRDVNKDFVGSHHGYRDAFRGFEEIGFKARALQAAIRLGEITGHGYLFEYAAKASAGLPRVAWLRRRLDQRPIPVLDDAVHGLTENQFSVLRLLCQGMTNKEIAAARGRSVNTIRNVLARELFPRFHVTTRSKLIAECVRRGLFEGRRSTDNDGTLHPR